MIFNIPSSISPCPATPYNNTNNNSTETICEDEYGMFRGNNGQIISVGTLFGILKKQLI